MRHLRRGLVAAVALALVVAMAAFWAPDVPVESLTSRWAPAPSRFLAFDGMSVHWRDEGPSQDSVPIVLIHGTSSSLHTWDAWADSLRGTRRVVRFDLPGFGLTGPAPDQDYSIERYVRFVRGLLARQGVHRAVLIGNSLGGWIAWRLAAEDSALVQRLVLVDAAGYPFAATSEPIGFRLARTPGLGPVMQRILPRSVVEASVRSVFGDPTRITPALVDRYYDLTRRAGNRAALVARAAQPRADGDTLRVRALRVPTLILWGSRDGLIPPMNAQRFARDIAGSRLVRFDGLGHVPHEEDPGRAFAPVREFLTTVR